MFLPKLKQGKLFEYVEKSNRSYYRTYKNRYIFSRGTKLNVTKYPTEPLHFGVESLATIPLHMLRVSR